jgi:ABC-type multidrug transport system fused ATPase/permease subunit
VNFRGEIVLDNVHFFYQMRPDKMVIKGINLKIEAGSVST